jgi:hypothetical protein
LHLIEVTLTKGDKLTEQGRRDFLSATMIYSAAGLFLHPNLITS